jgi:hypothetical protein
LDNVILGRNSLIVAGLIPLWVVAMVFENPFTRVILMLAQFLGALTLIQSADQANKTLRPALEGTGLALAVVGFGNLFFALVGFGLPDVAAIRMALYGIGSLMVVYHVIMLPIRLGRLGQMTQTEVTSTLGAGVGIGILVATFGAFVLGFLVTEAIFIALASFIATICLRLLGYLPFNDKTLLSLAVGMIVLAVAQLVGALNIRYGHYLLETTAQYIWIMAMGVLDCEISPHRTSKIERIL